MDKINSRLCKPTQSHQYIAYFMSAILTINVAACTGVTGGSIDNSTDSNPATVLSGNYVERGFLQSENVRIVEVNGEPNTGDQALLTKGRHTLTIEVRWTAGWKETVKLSGNFQGGREYVVLAYELQAGETPEDSRIAGSHAIGEGFMDAIGSGVLQAAAPFLLLTLPLWLPFVKAYDQSKDTGRKAFEHCCFVWIEDATSGAAIAGKRPYFVRSQ